MAKRPVKKYEPQFLRHLLKQMLLIRRFEEKCVQMYGLKKICGFLHDYIGEEAVAVGAVAAINTKKDYVFTAYRDHGHALACGMDPKACMAELFGKVTGCSRGKGGSMHLFDTSKGMYGGNGIVGAHIALASGAALKIKYKEEDAVVLCFFGDGAINQGVFHEVLNMSKLWELPIVYVCENNEYGMGTHYKRSCAVDDLSQRAGSYGIPGKQIGGMDVLEVHEEIGAAVKRAKQEHLPILLEAKTYRFRGHSISDPAQYRTKEEVDKYRQLDPIVALKADLEEAHTITEEEFKAVDQECRGIAEEAVRFAEASEEPPLQTLYEDVLA